MLNWTRNWRHKGWCAAEIRNLRSNVSSERSYISKSEMSYSIFWRYTNILIFRSGHNIHSFFAFKACSCTKWSCQCLNPNIFSFISLKIYRRSMFGKIFNFHASDETAWLNFRLSKTHAWLHAWLQDILSKSTGAREFHATRIIPNFRHPCI